MFRQRHQLQATQADRQTNHIQVPLANGKRHIFLLWDFENDALLSSLEMMSLTTHAKWKTTEILWLINSLENIQL